MAQHPKINKRNCLGWELEGGSTDESKRRASLGSVEIRQKLIRPRKGSRWQSVIQWSVVEESYATGRWTETGAAMLPDDVRRGS